MAPAPGYPSGEPSAAAGRGFPRRRHACLSRCGHGSNARRTCCRYPLGDRRLSSTKKAAHNLTAPLPRLTSFLRAQLMSFLRAFIARSASDMDRLTSIWKDLLSQQPHSIFQRFSWNRLAAEMFTDRLRPYVVCVEGDHGAAIIPAAVHPLNNRIEFIGEALFDYRDVLHSGDPETLRHAWQQLAMLDLPLQVVAIGPAASRRNWGGFNLTPFAAAPWVDRGSIEPSEFRMAHPRLGRQMRRLRKRGAELRLYGGQDSAVVRRLYQCKSSKFTASANLNLFLDISPPRIHDRSCQARSRRL